MQPGGKESWSSRNHTNAVSQCQDSPCCPQRELHPHGQGAKAPPQPFPCFHHPSQKDPILLEIAPQAARPEANLSSLSPLSEICIILRCPRSDPCPPPPPLPGIVWPGVLLCNRVNSVPKTPTGNTPPCDWGGHGWDWDAPGCTKFPHSCSCSVSWQLIWLFLSGGRNRKIPFHPGENPWWGHSWRNEGTGSHPI